MTFAAWYGIIIGVLMLGQWGFFLATGNVPEIQTEPIRLGFHLAAEALTAVGLLISGIGLLTGRRWSIFTFFVSLGMVIYSEIVSPGYFAQQGQWVMVGMFAALLLGAVISSLKLRKYLHMS